MSWRLVVMTCCLRMYMWIGREGAMTQVFLDAITRSKNGLPTPPIGFLAPYHGESYHLKDFRCQGQIRNKQALFNYQHSSLRNVIERCFVVLKERFPILDIPRGYPLRRQVQISIACCALHNFIRMQDRNDRLFMEYEEEDMIFNKATSTHENGSLKFDMSQQQRMHEIQESIANEI
ncbi:unnamed protein product [Cuscuta europaea]|uniref:DDE Tnp4 domain-containing protein n=1 Tax=Cuscuta europaea TaxID=41803 RepID=A0A9P0ZLU3_CUSEU|nr:unnamed protein product [Cuscuta europaea]